MDEYLNTLPQFILSVKDEEEDDTNVFITSIVDSPAMQKDFAKFSDVQKRHYFNETEDRRILSGVWVLADTPIYRRHEDFEFTVVFESERLEEMLLKHIKSGYSNALDFNHDENVIKDAFQNIEYWIYDGNPQQTSPILGLTLSDLGYEDNEITKGSILKSVYVSDETVWGFIKEGKFKGFSIDGEFDIEQAKQQFMDNNKIKKTTEMFKELSMNQFTGDIILNDGKILSVNTNGITLDGESINEGTFSTDKNFKIIVTDSEVVDFGFEDASQVEQPIAEVVEAVTEEPTAVVETKGIVETVEAIVEGVVVEEPTAVVETKDIVEAIVEPKAEQPPFDMSIIEDLKKEIAELKSSLAKEKTEKENVLKKNKIPKKQTVTKNPDNYIIRKVGKETIYIPK